MAVLPASRPAGGLGGGEHYRLEIILFELRRYFSNLLEWELRKIIELRRRGYGISRIARGVYGDRRKRYRVWRILRRLRKMKVLDCLLSGACCAKPGDAGRRHVAPANSIAGNPDDRASGEEAERGRGATFLPPGLRLPRLGRTQRLVLGALLVHEELSPSGIAAYVMYEFGVRLSRNAVWHALKRLERRGVVKGERGFYRIVSWYSRILVENFRVDGRIIWSSKERGFPTTLENALQLAALQGKTEPVEQIELIRIARRDLRKQAEQLRRYGWRYTMIYLNKRQGLKIEHRFHNPPIPARPEHIHEWILIEKMATKLAKEVATRSLGHG